MFRSVPPEELTMPGKLAWPLVAAGLLLSGCTNPFGFACSDIGRFAVHVEVRDAATNASAAEGATLVIRDGEYVDSRHGGPGAPPIPVLSAGAERAGTYQVAVRKEGYRDWVRENVQVKRAGWCDELQSVQLTARLERASSAR